MVGLTSLYISETSRVQSVPYKIQKDVKEA